MVPKLKRHNSSILYVHLPFTIAARIADFLDKCPRSCVRTYRESIVRSATLAASYFKLANNTELSDNQVKYKIREENLFKGINYLSETFVILEIIFECLPPKKQDSMSEEIQGLFDMMDREMALVNGVVASDTNRFIMNCASNNTTPAFVVDPSTFEIIENPPVSFVDALGNKV